jgi:hypothetical protein
LSANPAAGSLLLQRIGSFTEAAIRQIGEERAPVGETLYRGGPATFLVDGGITAAYVTAE